MADNRDTKTETLMKENRTKNQSINLWNQKGYGVDGRSSISDRGKRLFLFSVASRPALGPTQPPIRCVPGVLSSGIKRPEREADLSPPSSAEDKNGGAIPPRPHMPSWHSDLLINYRSKFNFFPLFENITKMRPYIPASIMVRHNKERLCECLCACRV
jgi:hypothetical protein